MSDEIRKAEDALDAARKKLSAQGQGVENTYAAAYQALVTLGARPQLRRKYR